MEGGLGALYLGNDRVLFRVWAPLLERVSVRLLGAAERTVQLQADARGYHEALIEGVKAGTRYYLVTPGGERLPDPASRWQPDGVNGPSAVVALDFEWRHEYAPPPLAEFVFYELHVGTFSPEGTLDAVIDRLPYLRDLGVNALELMPVAQFSGQRNWGYDGVFPYAVQNSYGGPAALARLVEACHAHDLAVVLDVVYNHLGPEGNVLGRFGPYYHDKYRTPWGQSINFDEADSDEVRRYFIQQALQWVFDFRVDALRLDAVHAIVDTSAYPFLAELRDTITAEARSRDRTVYLIAETDQNDPRVIRSKEAGGYGLHAQWLDDFHHSVHALCTGEAQGYYADFGDISALARCYRDGYVYSGQYSAYRRRRHGAPAPDASTANFVVCIQNHDQVGNRMLGERLSALVTLEAQKTAAAALLAGPYIPLLFMGEEYAEAAPFPFFVSHSQPDLIEAVRTGRNQEFQAFAWQGTPPDPQSEATFEMAKLDWELSERSPHRELLAFYRRLIALRKQLRLGHTDRDTLDVITYADDRTLLLLRRVHDPAAVAVVLCFNDSGGIVDLPLPPGIWEVLLDSTHACWAGPRAEEWPQLPSTGQIRLTMSGPSALLLAQTVNA